MDAESVLSYWQKILKIRKSLLDIFIYGRFEMVDREHASVFCYRRVGTTTMATIVMNFTDSNQAWLVPEEIVATLAEGTLLL